MQCFGSWQFSIVKSKQFFKPLKYTCKSGALIILAIICTTSHGVMLILPEFCFHFNWVFSNQSAWLWHLYTVDEVWLASQHLVLSLHSFTNIKGENPLKIHQYAVPVICRLIWLSQNKRSLFYLYTHFDIPNCYNYRKSYY